MIELRASALAILCVIINFNAAWEHSSVHGKEMKLPPLKWGWQRQGDSLQPVRCKKPPAPAKLLAHIFCSCKKGCGRGCGCRKTCLKCSIVCPKCEDNVFSRILIFNHISYFAVCNILLSYRPILSQ